MSDKAGGWDVHESRAWRETCEARGITWEPLDWFGGAVTVRVVANAAYAALFGEGGGGN